MVILEFTDDRIKLLEVAKKRQKAIALKGLAKKVIGNLSNEAVSGAVSDLLAETKTNKLRSLLVSVPRHLVTVRNVRFPSVDDAELRDMVSLQAGKFLPYAANELIWDFRIIDKRPDGYSDIFLVMAQRNVIDRFINILAGCKLMADRIILSSEALLGWYLALYGAQDTDASSEKINAVVDIDSSYIDIILVSGDKLEFSRSFPFKDNPEEMAEEIRKTIFSYEKEGLKRVSLVVLTGIEDRAAGLKPLIEEIYKTAKVEVVNPLKAILADDKEVLAGYLDLAKDISVSRLLGIAYSFDNMAMDLLPSEEKAQRTKKQKRGLLIRTSVLLFSMTLIFLTCFGKWIIDMDKQIDLINSKNKEVAPRVKKLREISQNISVIKQHLDMKGSSVDVIREVYKIVPAGMSISVLDFELGESLMLRGVASDLSSVFRFTSDLGKSAYFKECRIKYAQKRIVKTQELVDFELSCKLNKAAK